MISTLMQCRVKGDSKCNVQILYLYLHLWPTLKVGTLTFESPCIISFFNYSKIKKKYIQYSNVNLTLRITLLWIVLCLEILIIKYPLKVIRYLNAIKNLISLRSLYINFFASFNVKLQNHCNTILWHKHL